jgi:para-aminobenzoate synthetase component II
MPGSPVPQSTGGELATLSAMGARVLVVDNYDSFVFNLVQYLGQLGVECVVRRNDELSVAEAARLDVAGVLLSPGPGTPERAGICIRLVRELAGRVPLFGVCLGHQAIGVAFGATVGRAPELLHGKTSEVHHSGAGVLAGLPDPFTATRYHSLTIAGETLPDEIEVTGRTASGVVMAVRHRELAIEGVQFHPESVLTQGGHQMLANWLATCGYPGALERAPELTAQVERRRLAATA